MKVDIIANAGRLSVKSYNTETGAMTDLYECIETYEQAALLAQLAMTRKESHELIVIFPGWNLGIQRDENLYKEALELEKKVLENIEITK